MTRPLKMRALPETVGWRAERLERWLRSLRVCQCREPLPGRVYFAQPQCRLCSRPISPEGPAERVRI